MRLVQTSARGENSMDVESFSLLESGSTMPHRGIALPPLTWYFVLIGVVLLPFQSTNAEWITTPSSSNLNLFFSFLSTSPYPRMLIEPDDRSGLLLCLILPAHHQSRLIDFASTRLLFSVLFCVLILFGPLGIFIHRRFLTGPPIIVSWFRICWGRPRGGVGDETKEVIWIRLWRSDCNEAIGK